MNKLLKTNKIIVIFVSAAALLLTGCGKETPHKDFVAKVNNSYLSKEDLQTIVDSVPGNNQFRNEIIRNWINRECLYQQALKEGIIKSKEYQNLIENSKKELAAAMMLKKYFEDKEEKVEDSKLLEYFNSHNILFKFNDDAFFLNSADFANEDEAIKFRSTVIESNWNKAVNVFKKDASVTLNSFLTRIEIHPASLLRITEELNPKEISIVVKTGENVYTVVQLIDKYSKESIPPFDVVKNKVLSMYISNKKEIQLKEYIEDLYSKNDIEIK